MLEGMFFGIYPVTTPGNAQVIGLLVYSYSETPPDIAAFIMSEKWKKISEEAGRTLIEQKHSLSALVRSMKEYIYAGK